MQFSKGMRRCICTLAVVFSVSAFSQNTKSVVVSGEVLDPSHAAIIGATVEVHSQSGMTARLVSGPDGHFQVDLPEGMYNVVASHSGFKETARQLRVTAGAPAELQLVMPVSSMNTSVTVSAELPLVTESPVGQTQTTVSREDFKNTPATTVADILGLAPGVTLMQGNGPRDVVISVRGSNVRQTYGIRNVKVFEDGFPVTQPDGLARTDLVDPHAYSSVDVVQGPSSALYGNYATGGAINFHTRTGSEIQGLEVGADFGSFGYFNDYGAYGKSGDHYQIAGFLSNVRSKQATAHSGYNTITANLLATAEITPHDRLTFKFINNDLDTDLSLRLSLAQYRVNPFQKGCQVQASAAPGCATASVFVNGFNGPNVSLSAAELGLGRFDRRTIAGARWEHDLTDRTAWLTQFVFDNRDANQPTSSQSYRGTVPSFNLTSDIVRRGTSTSYGGFFFNYENIKSYSYNVAPGGNGTLGGLVQSVGGRHMNTGFHLREELGLGEHWTVVAGLGGEFTGLQALANNYSYPVGSTPTVTLVSADRTFFDLAPEVSAQYRATEALRLHARFGAGYGTPQVTQLFVTPQGVYGNNTQLKTQGNNGLELGGEWNLGQALQASVTGFYEWFHNEQVTQSPGVNLQSYTFNAPSSEHRGVEAGLDWRPVAEAIPGLRMRASYLYDNQIYTKYTEQLTTGKVSASFDRAGHWIPGVQPHFLNGRVLYDQTAGKLNGLGGFAEVVWRDAYPLDNGNLLHAPGYTLLNLNLHYAAPARHGIFARTQFFYEVENLANKTWVASANNITNTLNAQGQQNGPDVLMNATGSVYAGMPRASYGGVKVRF